MFGGFHVGTLYWRLLTPPAMLITVGAFLWPLSVVDALVLAVVLTVFVVFSPPLAFWAGGGPRRLDGSVLTLRGLFGRRVRVDLHAVTAAAIGGSRSRARSGAYGARWLVLAHPEGHRVSRLGLRRLAIPAEELDAVVDRVERAVVVTLEGVHRDGGGPGGGEPAVEPRRRPLGHPASPARRRPGHDPPPVLALSPPKSWCLRQRRSGTTWLRLGESSTSSGRRRVDVLLRGRDRRLS